MANDPQQSHSPGAPRSLLERLKVGKPAPISKRKASKPGVGTRPAGQKPAKERA
jgi:hypothetical protein